VPGKYIDPIPSSSVDESITDSDWAILIEAVEDIHDPSRITRRIAEIRKKHSDREALIAQALETPEGRIALAQAMVEPIRRSLDYQSIGRKLLMVEELPEGAHVTY
jgi:hypothetical protein